MSDGGKGSSPRPYSVSQEQFASNWDRIFSKNKNVQSSEQDRPVIEFRTVDAQPGDIRVNSMGVLEEFREQCWTEITRQDR